MALGEEAYKQASKLFSQITARLLTEADLKFALSNITRLIDTRIVFGINLQTYCSYNVLNELTRHYQMRKS